MPPHAFTLREITTPTILQDRLNQMLPRLVWRDDPWLDVTHPTFGARVDRTGAENAVRIQAALDRAESNGGGRVVLPAKFKCSARLLIPSNVELCGLGWHTGLIFDWTLASDAKGPTYIGNKDQIGGNQRIIVRDFSIEGAGNGTPWGAAPSPVSGLLLRVGSDLVVQNMRIYRVPGISLAYQGVQRIAALGNHVLEAGRDGITGYYYGANALSDVIVADNHIYLVGDDGIAVHADEGSVANVTSRVARVAILANTIFHQAAVQLNDAGRGICFDGVEEFAVVGNVVDSTFASGLHFVFNNSAGSTKFSCRDGVVSGNTVKRAGAVGDGTQPRVGIFMEDCEDVEVSTNVVRDSVGHGVSLVQCTDVQVLANRLRGNGATTVDFGINVDGTVDALGSGSGFCRRIVVAHNTVKESGANGIRNWRSDDTDIVDNHTIDNGRQYAAAGVNVLAAGIYSDLAAGQRARIFGNKSTDTDAVVANKKQSFGAALIQAAGALHELKHNDFSGNGAYTNVLDRKYDLEVNGTRWRSGTATPEAAEVGDIGDIYVEKGAGPSVIHFKAFATGLNTGWRTPLPIKASQQARFDFGTDVTNASMRHGLSTETGTTPYHDFQFGVTAAQTFNARLINDADGQLSIRFTKFAGGAGVLNIVGKCQVSDNFSHAGTQLAFFAHALATQPTVTGSRGANAALASVLTALAGLGLIIDSSTV